MEVHGQHKVLSIDSSKGFVVPSETIELVIEALTVDDFYEGDMVEGVQVKSSFP